MLEKGTILEGYRVDGILGEGGMGVVYQATQLSLNRTVALKVLAGDLSDDPTFRERFRREGLLQAAIDHPHIVTVYEAGETEHGLFLAMRLVRGPTLKDLILSDELDPERTLRILVPVADALDSAHNVGLIHRDIKPQNILIGARDHPYLADFGLTKAPDEVGLTDTGQFVGTIDYVSPEQIRGEKATNRSDVYALAGVLCECLTGIVPYSRPSEAAVLYAHMSEPPPRPTERRPDLPEELDEVVATGMAKNPEERQASASQLMRRAQGALGAAVESATAPAAPGRAQPTRPAGAGAPETQPAGAGPQAERAHGLDGAPIGDVTVTRAAPDATVRAGGPPARAHEAPAATDDAAGRAVAPARERLRARPLLAGVAVLALAAAVAGFAAGNSGSGGKSAGATSSASAGALQLSFPNGWRRLSGDAKVPGIDFREPIVLAPHGDARNRLVAGLVDASDPTLLPAGLSARSTGVPRGAPVRLGRLDALRYAGLDPKGAGRPFTLYSVPSSAGVATVACLPAPRGSRGFQRDCEQVATTLELAGAKPFPLGPSPAYARLVGKTVGKLTTDRAAGLRRLKAARSRAAQAAAARALSGAYSGAATTLRRASVSPADRGANASIADAFAFSAAAYRRLASAARRGDASAYAAATRSVRRGEQRARRALDGLKALGYSVR